MGVLCEELVLHLQCFIYYHCYLLIHLRYTKLLSLAFFDLICKELQGFLNDALVQLELILLPCDPLFLVVHFLWEKVHELVLSIK